MILHDFALSSASYRVRIALNLKGLSYETRNYRLRAGEQRSREYLAVNPAGLLPALEIDGLVLTQSVAIIDYLDATRPEPRLLPAGPAARARTLAMALTIACDIHPLNNLRVLKYLEDELKADENSRNAWYGNWITSGFLALEAMLPPHLDGSAPGLFEICLVPQVYNARRFSVDLSHFPRLIAHADDVAVHPAFVAASPTGL